MKQSVWWRFVFLFVWMLSCQPELSAQHYNYPLSYYSHLFLEQQYASYDSLTTPSFKSIPESWLILDSVWAYTDDEIFYTVASEKLYEDHLFNIHQGPLNVGIDLLGVQEIGLELSDTSDYSDTTQFYHNSRGFLIRGSIGDKLSFESSFMENQVFVPVYLRSFIKQREVYMGNGRAKILNNGGFDFSQSGGYLSYSPTANVNLQFGHGKNFIGNGHRSLLLSDNAVNYPYIRASFRLLHDKLSYHTTFAGLLNLERLPQGSTPESRFKTKDASFHYVEYQPNHRIRLGVFEGIIWQRYDNQQGTLPFQYASMNPVILVHSLLQPNDSINNSLLGIDASFQVTNNIKVYGQYLLDGGNNGYQIGVRTVNFPIDNLYLLVERNQIDPFAYTSQDHLQSYSHLSQELGHPLGANFQEIVAKGTYFYKKRIFTDLQINYYTQGVDYQDLSGVTNAGSNIFLDQYQGNIGEGRSQSTLFSSLTIGYFFNPKSNLNAYLRWVHRTNNNPEEHANSFVRIGIRTSIFNSYDDF